MTKKESQETRIALLENNHNTVMDKIDEILHKFEKFEDKLDEALEHKANKWVEDAMRWGLYTVVGAVIVALLALVIK